MAGLNKVLLVGHVGKDPEVTRFDNNASVARFSLATTENYKDKNGEWQSKTEWHNITCWRNLAERAEKTVHKGDLVYVEGKIRNNSYTDKDNVKRNVTDIEASSFSIFVSKEQSANAKSSSPQNNFSNGNQNPSAEVMDDDNESGLPF